MRFAIAFVVVVVVGLAGRHGHTGRCHRRRPPRLCFGQYRGTHARLYLSILSEPFQLVTLHFDTLLLSIASLHACPRPFRVRRVSGAVHVKM